MPIGKLCLMAFVAFCLAPHLCRQERPAVHIKPTPQLQEIILAVPDLILQNPEQTTEMADMLGTLNQVLWEDLKFAGCFTLASKSFYPRQTIRNLQALDYDAWRDLPFKVSFLSAGTVKVVGGSSVHVTFQAFDMVGRSSFFGDEISGDKSNIRFIAHRWADELVYKLTAGASQGIASTKIAFTAKHGAAKEIYVMDYDGYDQRAFTRNGSLNLFPVWSFDNSKIAFISDQLRPWELSIYSYVDGSRLRFPVFNSVASTPAFSPDGEHIAFALRTSRGDTDIFVSKLDGSDQKDITNNPAIDSSPTWSPSGRQLAFASNRDTGSLQIYLCDADGTNVRPVFKEGGEADSPSWSPDGKWIAFHWKPRRTENFDIYIGEVGSGQIHQLTNSSGNNTNPSWAPDGRHLAFDSDRTGGRQIYIMQVGADPSDIRMITNREDNSTPAWGNYPGRE